MSWKREASPVVIVETLLSGYIGIAGRSEVENLNLDATAKKRFEEKAYCYEIAWILNVILQMEQLDSRFSTVREEFEHRIFPATKEEGMGMLEAIKKAWRDLAALQAEQYPILWAHNWLIDIGIEVYNPVTETLFSCDWKNYLISVWKLIKTFKPTL